MYADCDLKRAKRQRAAEGQRRAQVAEADKGPYLGDNGRTIVIPSPAPNPDFIKILRRYGFQYSPGYTAAWIRDTKRPYQGKRYGGQSWLEWAQDRYAEAWPEWKDPREVDR